jgi:hypothetical protein
MADIHRPDPVPPPPTIGRRLFLAGTAGAAAPLATQRNVAARGPMASPALGHAVQVEVEGLDPGRHAFMVNDLRLPGRDPDRPVVTPATLWKPVGQARNRSRMECVDNNIWGCLGSTVTDRSRGSEPEFAGLRTKPRKP